MALKRCENGHYFDPAKHTSCPSCGVQNINFEPTKKKADAPAGGGTPATIGTPPAQPRADAPPKAARPPADDGKTVVVPPGKGAEGLNPVVGWLVCVDGPDRGRDFRIKSQKNFVGRSQTMDIYIAGDESISREKHAAISYNPKNRQFKVHAGESRGLVYLNGEEVDGTSALKAGDHIELGRTKLMFVPLCTESFNWE
jgi:Inner membrane component of T3SS, cytoplasmic domain